MNIQGEEEVKIITLPVGPIQANCYIVYDENSKETMIIDPGDEGPLIMEEVKKRHLQVKYIVNTHGHGDHIGANEYVKEATGAPLAVHELDSSLLTSPRENLSAMLGHIINKPAPDRFLHEGDELQLGKSKFRVLHTPGHTRGGICLLGDEALFSGDTLFENSIGRTDFPGGSHQQLINSIKTKLLVLDDKMIVYPGHGDPTTIGWEKNNNPYLE